MSLMKKTAARPVVAPIAMERMISMSPSGGADRSRKVLKMLGLGLMI